MDRSETRGLGGQWLEWAVFALDAQLRQRQGVFEYSDDVHCLFRTQRTVADRNLTLTDGTPLRAGDPLLLLHIWNEHVPFIAPNGPTLSWARQLSFAIDVSLRMLADFLEKYPEFDDIKVICADMSLVSAERSQQIIRIASHYGFERSPCADIAGPSLHRLGEHIFMLLLVLASNPFAGRASVFQREHTIVYLSRRLLESRYVHQQNAFMNAAPHQPIQSSAH
jgi:hypothetical protein